MINRIKFVLFSFAALSFLQIEALAMEREKNDLQPNVSKKLTKEEFNNNSSIEKMNYLYDIIEHLTERNQQLLKNFSSVEKENSELKNQISSLTNNSSVQDISRRLDNLTQNTSQELNSRLLIVQNYFQQENNKITNQIGQEIKELKLSQRGSAKAWVVFNGSNPNILNSYGVSSVVKNSIGNYTINFLKPFSSSDYCSSLSPTRAECAVLACTNNQTQQSFVFDTFKILGWVSVDPVRISACFFGN